MRRRWLVPLALVVACSSRGPEAPDVAGTTDLGDAGTTADTAVDAASDAVASDAVDDTLEDGGDPIAISFDGMADGDFVWGTTIVQVATQGRIDAVEFFLDGASIRVDRRSPFVAEFATGGLTPGAHEVRAIAVSGDTEAEAQLTVTIDGQRPTIEILQPGLGNGGPVAGELTVEVTADDNDEIAYVEVAVDNVNILGRLYGAARVGVFDVDVGPGTHRLTAVAVDRSGLSRSQTVNIFVCEDDAAQPCASVCRSADEFDDLVAHCGGCGIACANGEICAAGACECEAPRRLCGSVCADVGRDRLNCGECGLSCTEACLNGECVTGVPEGFQLIAPGEFIMGSTADEWGAQPFETPAHLVTITRPYLIAETEVTQRQWFDAMGSTAASNWNCGLDCPVESVTWWEAAAYANWLSESEGLEACYLPGGCTDTGWGFGRVCRSLFINGSGQNPLNCEGYRLPTEAEWEFAARAGATGTGTRGEILSFECRDNIDLASVAWFDCNARGETHEVAQLLPNAFGLYDMIGNVFEWTGDEWADFSGDAETDPIGGNSAELVLRSMRGGSYNERSDRMRISARLSENPEGALPFLGFRVARSWNP